jgi:type VI secretion system secreted protein VgrG
LAGTLIVAALVTGATVLAAGPAPVGLGTAAPFAVLAGTPAISNTGATTIVGDVGIAPALAVTGFPPGTVSGTVHKGDAVAIQAKSDLTAAYTDAAGRPATATHATLGGLTLVGGVYTAGGATLGLTGTLTLDGQNDPNSVWIFQATSDLVTASSSAVELVNGASACNVYWQVTSSATLGSGSTFVGTIMALTSITMAAGVTVDGRALARNGEVTLINDTISSGACSAASATAAPSASTAPSATSSAKPSVPPTDTDELASAGSSGTTTIIFVAGLLALALVVIPARRRLERYRIR